MRFTCLRVGCVTYTLMIGLNTDPLVPRIRNPDAETLLAKAERLNKTGLPLWILKVHTCRLGEGEVTKTVLGLIFYFF